MVDLFKHQQALIIGGSSGLGYASALKLARHGMNLCIVHRDPKMQLEAIENRFDAIRKTGVSLRTFNLDATRTEKVDLAISKITDHLGDKKINLFLHSISKGNLKPLTGGDPLTTADFVQTINSMGVNLYTWSHRLFEAGLFSQPARILSFTSEGNSRPMAGYAAVSAAKVTLEAITRNIALEWAPHGITANCIQAGVTKTSSLDRIPHASRLIDNIMERNPFHSLTTSQKVADVVFLLAQQEASWINGTVLKVDGGESLQ
ncbi:MAG: SDR family oxidoreductase [Nonlabens sp.]